MISETLQVGRHWSATENLLRQSLKIIEACGGTPTDRDNWSRYHADVLVYRAVDDRGASPEPPVPLALIGRPDPAARSDVGTRSVGRPPRAFGVTTAETYWTRPFPLTAPDPVDVDRRALSGLLAAGSQVVPFSGRSAELAALMTWRDGRDALAVMLVHGPGGQGKTRLAAAFAAESANAGWAVVRAGHSTEVRPEDSSTPPTDPPRSYAGLLVVVDYAERWPRIDLERLLQDPAVVRGGVPARVLLLARPSDFWWKSLANPLFKLNAAADDLPLGPLADTVAQRKAVFDAARDRFAQELNAVGCSTLQPPGLLSDDTYGLVLTLHMAALVAVDAHLRGKATPSDPRGLSEYLLTREYDHWQTMHETGGIHVESKTMARLVAVATLTRPLPNKAAAAVLSQVGLATDPLSAQLLLDAHAVCYPPTMAGSSLEPLFPDRLGEDFLADLLPDRQAERPRRGDAWAADLPERLITGADGQAERAHTPAALAVLVETSARWEHVRRDYLFPQLRRNPEVILEAGGACLMALAGFASYDVLETLDKQLPKGRHVELDGGIAALSRKLTDFALLRSTDEATQAMLYETLADRMSNAGLYPDALAASCEAVRIRRNLAALDPAAHRPRLADCLDHLGIDLWHIGQPMAALDAMNESVGMFRQLAASDRGVYETDLAAELCNLAGCLMDLGRYSEALPHIEEAEEVYRRLSKTERYKYDVELGAIWKNSAAILGGLGRPEDALRSAQDAVAVYRRLAAGRRHTYEPDLAGALRTLGSRLAAVGRHEDSVAANKESVEIWQHLAQVNPEAHESDLAVTLHNLGLGLRRLGHIEDAVAAIEGSLEIFGRLVTTAPEAHEPATASAFNTLGGLLSTLGYHDEATSAVRKAVELRRRLADANPGTYEPRLADSLAGLGHLLSDLGSLEEARERTREAVAIFERLSAVDEAKFGRRLAESSEELERIIRLSRSGRRPGGS